MKLYMLIGIPGTGKSTLRNKLYTKINALIVCPDDLRNMMLNAEHSHLHFEQSIEPAIWSSIYYILESTMELQRNIIYDATNINKSSRFKIIEIAKEHGYDVVGIVMTASSELAIKRDSERKRSVGSLVMKRMIASYQPPSLDEGFLEITDDIKILQ